MDEFHHFGLSLLGDNAESQRHHAGVERVVVGLQSIEVTALFGIVEQRVDGRLHLLGLLLIVRLVGGMTQRLGDAAHQYQGFIVEGVDHRVVGLVLEAVGLACLLFADAESTALRPIDDVVDLSAIVTAGAEQFGRLFAYAGTDQAVRLGEFLQGACLEGVVVAGNE